MAFAQNCLAPHPTRAGPCSLKCLSLSDADWACNLTSCPTGRTVRAGVANAGRVASAAAAILTDGDGADVGAACTNFTLTPCDALVAGLEQRTPTTLTLFNPSAWTRVEHISLLSPTSSVVVTNGSNGAVIPSQASLYNASDLPQGTAWVSLAFVVTLPPLGSASVVLTATASDHGVEADVAHPPAHPDNGTAVGDATIVLSNKQLSATFSANGTLQSIALSDGPTLQVGETRPLPHKPRTCRFTVFVCIVSTTA